METELATRDPQLGGLSAILRVKEVYSDYESEGEPATGETQQRSEIHRISPSYRTLEFDQLIDALESDVQRRQRSIRSGNQPLVVLQEKTIVDKEAPRYANGDNMLLDWMREPINYPESIDHLLDSIPSPGEEQPE